MTPLHDLAAWLVFALLAISAAYLWLTGQLEGAV